MREVPRPGYRRLLETKIRRFPAVALLGPRQGGKSTLARALRLARRERRVAFDLERPSHLLRVRTAPEEDLGALQQRPGLIVIDEIQREPSLFPLLRVLLDEPSRRARYLLLGSASPTLVREASESLAGRAVFLDLTPFLAAEVASTPARLRRLWLRGGFPRSFLARSDAASLEWREAYLRALLERDIPALRPGLEAATLSRLVTMLAHLHGGLVNESELAGGLGVTAPTVGRYIDVLEGLFAVRRLPPYFANVGKRLTKAPREPPRPRPLARPARNLRLGRPARSPQGRCVVGGLRDRAGPGRPRPGGRQSPAFLLAYSRGGGGRPHPGDRNDPRPHRGETLGFAVDLAGVRRVHEGSRLPGGLRHPRGGGRVSPRPRGAGPARASSGESGAPSRSLVAARAAIAPLATTTWRERRASSPRGSRAPSRSPSGEPPSASPCSPGGLHVVENAVARGIANRDGPPRREPG